MTNSNTAPYLAVVLPAIAVLLLAVIALAVSCCKIDIFTRIRGVYWRYKSSRKSKNGVFTLQVHDDLVSNRIYRPRVTKAESLTPTPSSSIQKDNIRLLDNDAEIYGQGPNSPGQLSPDLSDTNIRHTSDVQCRSADTDYYLSMDKPTIDVRRCHTICGSPSEPYPVDDSKSYDFPLIPCQDNTRSEIFSLSRGSDTTARDIPVARCSPFRTKEDKGNKLKLANRQEKAKTVEPVPAYKKRETFAEIMPSPMIRRKQWTIEDEFDLDTSLTDSFEDLFKDAWWHSSLSINQNNVQKDEIKPTTPHIRNSTNYQPSPKTKSTYVQMNVETPPLPFRPPQLEQRRGRSVTLPNEFGIPARDFYLNSPTPRACSTIPNYVNFRGTSSLRF